MNVELSASVPAPRLALLGFGRLAQGYYRPALRSLRLPVAGIADPDPGAQAAARAAFPAAVVAASPEALLARVRPDAVLIATPPSLHLAVWELARARGIPALVEKPFLLPAQLAAFTSRPSDPPLMVNFNRRCWPPYRRLAGMLRDGHVGRVESLSLALEVDPRRWSAAGHRDDPREGGALHDLGCHLLDLVWLLLGDEPAWLSARGDPARGPLRIRLRLRGGARVTCRLGYGTRGRERVVVRGTRGTLWMLNPNAALHAGPPAARIAAGPADLVPLALRATLRGRSLLRHSIRAAIAHFAGAVAAGRTPEPGLADALRNVRWLAAAERSLARGGAREPLDDAVLLGAA